MPEDLIDLRNELLAASDQLLEERNAAAAANDRAKVAVAEAEFDRIGVVLATVQFAIANQQALNMNAVAARLQECVETERAIGLSAAADALAKVVSRIRGTVPGTGPGPDPTGPATPPGGQQPQPPVSTGLRAKPGQHQAVIDKLIAGAGAQNLDPMTVLTIVAIESDFNPMAVNPLSSAGGLFQFIDSTWVSAGGAQFPGHGGRGNGHAAAAPIDDQIAIGCRFIAKTIADLAAQLGPMPSTTRIYMAHQQGLGGALKILRSDPNASIESIVGVEVARNNGFGGLTVAQTIAKFNAVVRSNEDEARALVTTAVPSGGGGPAGSLPGASIGLKAVHVALTELEMFARQNGRTLTESEEPLRRRVLQYFSTVGRPDIVDPSAEPWSAAFISFVMLTAGATSDQFPFSPSHHKYILTGLNNRIRNNLNAPVVYFDKNETAPKVGDLIGFSRTAEIGNRADLERRLPDTFFPSHTDLVIDVSDGKIKVIGGNVNQTILTQTVRTDPSGRIHPSDEHFFVLRTNF
jgi:hypothetical protein